MENDAYRTPAKVVQPPQPPQHHLFSAEINKRTGHWEVVHKAFHTFEEMQEHIQIMAPEWDESDTIIHYVNGSHHHISLTKEVKYLVGLTP